jgi:hypothetical protein
MCERLVGIPSKPEGVVAFLKVRALLGRCENHPNSNKYIILI